MKKSAQGYYKFYNAEGKSCRVKCKSVEGSCIIKFKHVNEHEWLYHSPNRDFNSCTDAINFILKNLISDGMIFKVVKTACIKNDG